MLAGLNRELQLQTLDEGRIRGELTGGRFWQARDKPHPVDTSLRNYNTKSCVKITRFEDSTHAQNRGRERNVSLQAMKDVVVHHDTKTQQYRGDHGGFVYKFSKETKFEHLVVVAEVKKYAG